MNKICRVCGTYEILHKKLKHAFIDDEEEERRFAFDKKDYLVEIPE